MSHNQIRFTFPPLFPFLTPFPVKRRCATILFWKFVPLVNNHCSQAPPCAISVAFIL